MAGRSKRNSKGKGKADKAFEVGIRSEVGVGTDFDEAGVDTKPEVDEVEIGSEPVVDELEVEFAESEAEPAESEGESTGVEAEPAESESGLESEPEADVEAETEEAEGESTGVEAETDVESDLGGIDETNAVTGTVADEAEVELAEEKSESAEPEAEAESEVMESESDSKPESESEKVDTEGFEEKDSKTEDSKTASEVDKAKTEAKTNDSKTVFEADDSKTVSELDEAKKETGYDRKNIVQKGTEKLDPRVKDRLDDVRRSQMELPLGPSLVPAIEESTYEDIKGAPNLLLISGSPRKHACVSLLNIIEKGARDSGVNTRRFLLSDKRINPCISCNVCMKTGICAFAESTLDDYKELKDDLDSADGVAIVSPIYFSGPSAQLKALYDRFQPYWASKYVLQKGFPKYRPSQLFIVGSGGDPHGYDPLVAISKSCLQTAGFSLDKTYDFVGYLAPKDAPKELTDEDMEELSKAEILVRKKAIIRQNELRNLALEAGQAFGRVLRLNAAEK